MPTCRTCSAEKAQDEFYLVRATGLYRRHCKVCDRAAAMQRYFKAYAENPRKFIERAKAWAAERTASVKAYRRRWHQENREHHREWCREYAKKNPGIFVAKVQKRNAGKLRATPVWANDFFMREAYLLAALRTKVTGVKWVVDHIVPLRSKLVCGLHTHTNLRVVTHAHNTEKSNKFWPDMETAA